MVRTDENGREYVTLGYNELGKNHQGHEKNGIGEEPRMYGQADDLCPVSSFNTLRPRQDGRRFPDDIFKSIFVNENV